MNNSIRQKLDSHLLTEDIVDPLVELILENDWKVDYPKIDSYYSGEYEIAMFSIRNNPADYYRLWIRNVMVAELKQKLRQQKIKDLR